MAEEERTPEDMRIVRDIVDSAEDFSRPLTILKIFSFQPSETDSRFEFLVSRVEEVVTGGRNFLSDQAATALAKLRCRATRVRLLRPARPAVCARPQRHGKRL